jgi:hypothetical protein
MQRGSSASIKTFYHQIASTNQVFRLKPDQTPTQQRPVSQYGSIKPREFKLNSKFDQSSTSEIKSSSNLRLVNSQLNEHFGKHFGRNYRSLKRIKQHPSVDCHQKIPSTDLVGYSQKKEPKITVTSSKSRLADNLSNEIKSEEESEQVVYMDEEAEPDKAQTLRDELYRDAPACLGRQIESLERCQQIFGVLEEAEEKSKQRLKEERMRELKYKAFTGNYKDFEPAYPWEAVSHYLPEEPEFNSVTSTAVYKREPLLSVSEKDELEIAKLMEDLNDKYEFFLKHTHMEYDSDYAFIKGDPAKMTHIEIDFLKRQYDSKSTGYNVVM